MYIKAFLKTNGSARCYPIHAPINMCHIQGSSYLKSMWARFLQVGVGQSGAGPWAYGRVGGGKFEVRAGEDF